MKALFAAILILFVSACNSVAVKSDEPQPVAVADSVKLDELGDYLMKNGDLSLIKKDGKDAFAFCYVVNDTDDGCLYWFVDTLFGTSI